MLLQILAACPAPAPPAWITALAIGSRIGWARANASSDAADHEGEVAGGGGGDPAGNRRVDHRVALRRRPLPRPSVRSATSIVEQSISNAPARRLAEHLVAVDAEHVLRGGKHGDDDVRVPHRFLGRRGAARSRLSTAVLRRLLAEIESADLMPRLGEVRRHSAAHVAKADECDLRHGSSVPSSSPAASRRRRPCLPSGPRSRTGRGTGGARSGCPGRAASRTRR